MSQSRHIETAGITLGISTRAPASSLASHSGFVPGRSLLEPHRRARLRLLARASRRSRRLLGRRGSARWQRTASGGKCAVPRFAAPSRVAYCDTQLPGVRGVGLIGQKRVRLRVPSTAACGTGCFDELGAPTTCGAEGYDCWAPEPECDDNEQCRTHEKFYCTAGCHDSHCSATRTCNEDSDCFSGGYSCIHGLCWWVYGCGS